MEALNVEIISSHEIYKFWLLEINFHICKSLTGGNVFFCFTRRNFKSHDEIKLKKPSLEYNFYCSRGVVRNMLQELPGAIEYVNTLNKEWSNNTTEKMDSEVTRRLIALYNNKEYYLAIKQSNMFESYYICLLRRNLNGIPIVETDFQFTVLAACELLSRLPTSLNAADGLCFDKANEKSRWAKEPKISPLERMTTDMV